VTVRLACALIRAMRRNTVVSGCTEVRGTAVADDVVRARA
jgi:hypothetical protein